MSHTSQCHFRVACSQILDVLRNTFPVGVFESEIVNDRFESRTLEYLVRRGDVQRIDDAHFINVHKPAHPSLVELWHSISLPYGGVQGFRMKTKAATTLKKRDAYFDSVLANCEY